MREGKAGAALDTTPGDWLSIPQLSLSPMLRHSGVKPSARRWPGLRLERLLGERQLVQDSGAERRKGDLGKTRIV